MIASSVLVSSLYVCFAITCLFTTPHLTRDQLLQDPAFEADHGTAQGYVALYPAGASCGFGLMFGNFNSSHSPTHVL